MKKDSMNSGHKAAIDRHFRTVVGGRLFFPLGVYECALPGSEAALRNLDEIAASPFNTVMNYSINSANYPVPPESPAPTLEAIRSYLDAAGERGLKVIYSLKDFYPGGQFCPKRVGPYAGCENMVRGIVRKFKNHPALLAWYLSDEPDLNRGAAEVAARNALVRKLDPHHPTWTVISLIKQDISMDAGRLGDVLGADPYPVPHTPCSQVSDWAGRFQKAIGGRKAFWHVPQICDLRIYEKNEKISGGWRRPGRDEIRNMCWQHLALGATGLVFYSFFDLKRDPAGFAGPWRDSVAVAREIAELVPVLLARGRPQKIEMLEPRGGIQVRPETTEGQPRKWRPPWPEGIVFTARRRGGAVWIIAVNNTADEINAVFKLDRKPDAVLERLSGRGVRAAGSTFSDRFAPLAVHAYMISFAGGLGAATKNCIC